MTLRATQYFFLVSITAIYGLFGMSSYAQDNSWENAWLDESYGARALFWAEAETNKTRRALQQNQLFEVYQLEAEAVLTRPGRLPNVRFSGNNVFNYYQGTDHPLGLWQRTSRVQYYAGQPRWETLLDFDALAQEEDRKWIFAGANCNDNRCLVSISDNGKDAHEVREFDLSSMRFVENGFMLREDKSSVTWYDTDTLLVGSTLEGGRANEAGLPATLRLWRRGTSLSSAVTLFEIDAQDAFQFPMLVRAGGVDGFVVATRPSFFDTEYTYIGLDGAQAPIPLPRKAQVIGAFKGGLLIRLNQDWLPPGTTELLPSGALVSVSLVALMQSQNIADVKALYIPKSGEAIRSTASIGDTLYIELLRAYRSRIIAVNEIESGIHAETLPLPADHFITLQGTEAGQLALKIEAPLSPPRLSLFDPENGTEKILYRSQPAFKTDNLTTKILHTTSEDGTLLSYTIMHRKNMEYNGKNPTLVYGYGGFDVAVTPRYEAIFGKLWLEKGGVYVHAYLRGGGERGPAWHQTAMLKNRQQPYDDMAAILEDLHKRGITAPKHTGIMGRSNGGLMVAALMTQRPELMNAVVVGGPLIDMLTYHKLGPGSTWAAEYGDPRDSSDIRDYIAGYSPLQRLKRNAVYPTPLIITSVDDDRVLPGHARRFHAKLKTLGHDTLYFEDKQGGHYWELAGGPAPGDYHLRSTARAIEYTYLHERLAQ
ncbi:prolyl oligopeptidase family serine peptidase [Kordiimonas aquimaris]|uniref:prolyl oligopeptidase family serine peptidase n=1 Tax=Kordiimonas aquimaris TaxID=707591 RepID=UPI0021D151E6|nr:prolyl oligopeptidase family serine peptidase [Kordiimonas aquimaris]